jgi:hypothetical protein
MTPEEALRLIKQDEGQTVEFKKSLSEQEQAIDSLCAFANVDGGTVFFGVRPNAQIVGVDVGENTIENLANKVNRSLYPQTIPRIEPLTVDDRTIVAVTVEKASKGSVIFTGRPFCRSGSTNQQMSWDETRNRILGEESQDFWLEPGAPAFAVHPGVDAATAETARLLMTLAQTSGDEVTPVIEWSGANVEPRQPLMMRQNQPPGARFQEYQLKPALARPSPPGEEVVFDIRFRWHGATRQYRWVWPLYVREKGIWGMNNVAENTLEPRERSTLA